MNISRQALSSPDFASFQRTLRAVQMAKGAQGYLYSEYFVRLAYSNFEFKLFS